MEGGGTSRRGAVVQVGPAAPSLSCLVSYVCPVACAGVCLSTQSLPSLLILFLCCDSVLLGHTATLTNGTVLTVPSCPVPSHPVHSPSSQRRPHWGFLRRKEANAFLVSFGPISFPLPCERDSGTINHPDFDSNLLLLPLSLLSPPRPPSFVSAPYPLSLTRC